VGKLFHCRKTKTKKADRSLNSKVCFCTPNQSEKVFNDGVNKKKSLVVEKKEKMLKICYKTFFRRKYLHFFETLFFCFFRNDVKIKERNW